MANVNLNQLSHSHQDSMVLAQRQKYRSMEQNRKPRDKPMHLWTPIFDKGGKVGRVQALNQH